MVRPVVACKGTDATFAPGKCRVAPSSFGAGMDDQSGASVKLISCPFYFHFDLNVLRLRSNSYLPSRTGVLRGRARHSLLRLNRFQFIFPHANLHVSSNVSRPSLLCSFDGSPRPMAQSMFDFQRPSGKNSLSTASFLKPDIGPQSKPSARAAMMNQAACMLAFLSAVVFSTSSLVV